MGADLSDAAVDLLASPETSSMSFYRRSAMCSKDSTKGRLAQVTPGNPNVLATAKMMTAYTNVK